MTTRKDIIQQIKEDLSEKVNVAGGYKTDVIEVRIGVVNPDKFTMRPAIGIWSYEDVVEEQLMDDDLLRTNKFIVYGYIDVTEDYDDYEPLYDFVKDIEQFLYSSDNRHTKNTRILNTKTNYGGVNIPVGYFIIFFDVDYYQTDF